MAEMRTVTEAETHFRECLDVAERGDHVVFTQNGQPIAALVPIDDLRRLHTLQGANPSGGLASLAGGWDGSDELAARVDEVYSRRSGGRSLP